MTPEEEIKQLALERGAEMVGIASVVEIDRYAPPGHRPNDILHGAKSVVAFAGRMALRGAWRSPDQRTHLYNRQFARVRAGVAMSVAMFIESKYGYYSLAEIPSSMGLHPSISHKLCAEMAGLGTRSMAGATILNKELGLLSISICITTMPLAADSPMKEAVCPHPSCMQLWERKHTTPCLEVCPECLSGELEGGKVKWMRYDRRFCSTRAQNMGPSALYRTLLTGINEPDLETRKNILLGSFARSALEAVASGNVVGQCGECLRSCPVCLQARSLKVKSPEPA